MNLKILENVFTPLQAGIPSKHLTIALEPEAASLFCQYLPVEKFSVRGASGFGDAKPGTTYMVVDLGGDIFLFQVNPNPLQS